MESIVRSSRSVAGQTLPNRTFGPCPVFPWEPTGLLHPGLAASCQFQPPSTLPPARAVVYERQAFQPGHGMENLLTTPRSTVARRRWGPPALVTLAAMPALTVPSP